MVTPPTKCAVEVTNVIGTTAARASDALGGVEAASIMEPTKTDSTNGTEWKLNDVVIQLREWGTDRTYELPTATSGEWLVGAARTCAVYLTDDRRYVSRRHARLSRDHETWTLTDNGSKNGLWLDNARRPSFVLAPGIEVGIGSLRLIAESDRVIALRAFLSRILGWSDERREQVDRALRAIRDMATQRSSLVLNGEGDLVSVARALHQRALGDGKPFIVCDPRRMSMRRTPRSAENFGDVRAAMQAAALSANVT
ncbi:MAG: FHA domain-containing protein [Kofleriaceae bacterium]